ncbi:flagellar basal-body rod protein FlgF [Pseudoroseicyclus aestuarii]|uniref:Flagellar basal-body rod protein FlgF n=1 Tax=Pseudoroseicyclus aestuarii TaxID=1795041 RepID=A0A318SS49_9RHOB|nr:flagellar basal-body rod protein FlgF [Pseudoroseicyclus aestuarii]PYE84372.1 flagellar basal-body rod protein FlgF [Pseudoroseicyclus aestuarii]
MDNSTYVSVSLARALQRELDVTANNVANASTAGFKGERVAFDSFVVRGEARQAPVSYVIDRGSYIDARPGSLSQTGNPLDLAVQGSGWLAYRTPDGQTAYGRNGQLTLDAQGGLVTAAGAPVLDRGGAPIAIPPDAAGSVSIAADGTISAQGFGPIAQIGLFDLPDLQSYSRIGGGLLLPPEDAQAPLPDMQSSIVQGAIETSNVEPVLEMTRMLAIQKAYDRATTLIQAEDDRQRSMLQRLGDTA